MAAAATVALPYQEPDLVTILVHTSFLLLLNIVNAALDRIVYCGLLGQVFVGIAWGSPGAEWLSLPAEQVIVQLGYLGLILLVYQGGLSTSFESLKANLVLSSAVALTGIAVPISLSFSLQPLLGATPLQAFAAGAALCSTSLGTTFTVLASSGLSSSRLGVVLTSAAMMDDVVGLVMVRIISNLGSGSISPVTVVRPMLVSLAFAVVVPLTCRFAVKPATLSVNRYRATYPSARLGKILTFPQTAFVVHTLLLIGLVAGSSYAGTSNLFAAYIAGATISWWDTEVPHVKHQLVPAKSGMVDGKTSQADNPKNGHGRDDQAATAGNGDEMSAEHEIAQDIGERSIIASPSSKLENAKSGVAIYERYYQQPVSKVLQPFFFASIGFSIPITRMFIGHIVWRGIVFTILMAFGKLLCGLWLVRYSFAPLKTHAQGISSKMKLPATSHVWGRITKSRTNRTPGHTRPRESTQNVHSTNSLASTTPSRNASTAKPFSLQPSLILALAMTARGEIGFLISAVAESNGVFSSSGSDNSGLESDIFLVVMWAIVLCTIIGPLGVGLCVRRVKLLEEGKDQEQEGVGRDVLGVWGVG